MLLLRRSLINACEDAFFQYLPVALSGFHHLIDKPPLRQSAYVTVVNKHVCLYLAAEMLVIAHTTLLGKITVHGIELHSALPTPFHSVVEKFPLSHRP